MRPRFLIQFFLLPVVCCAAEVAQNELPLLAVKISNSRTYRGNLDPKTTADGLWLRFGSSAAIIRRRFEWELVDEVTADGRKLSPQEVMNLVAGAQPPANRATNRIEIAPSELPLSNPPPRLERQRIVDVIFDVALGNWDQDVETDGLLVQVTPIDEYGVPVEVTGTLNTELFANYRIDQDSAPHGRGSEVRTVGQWSVRLDQLAADGNGVWIRLPFQASMPETDTRWAPFGLVHFQFVVPGSGVYYRSIDGLRIRPWAPFRDGLERKSRERFLQTERQ